MSSPSIKSKCCAALFGCCIPVCCKPKKKPHNVIVPKKVKVIGARTVSFFDETPQQRGHRKLQSTEVVDLTQVLRER